MQDFPELPPFLAQFHCSLPISPSKAQGNQDLKTNHLFGCISSQGGMQCSPNLDTTTAEQNRVSQMKRIMANPRLFVFGVIELTLFP